MTCTVLCNSLKRQPTVLCEDFPGVPDKKLWGHVHLRGWGVRECEGYKTPKITVFSGSVRFATPFMFLSVAVNKGSHYFSLASVSEESKNLVDTRIRHLC